MPDPGRSSDQPALVPLTDDADVDGDGIRALCSVERGGGPAPGVYRAPFLWGDLLEGQSPTVKAGKEGSYAIFHTLEVGWDVRMSYCTIVTAPKAPGDPVAAAPRGQVRVDSRVSVENRLFLRLIQKERAYMARTTTAWRENGAAHLIRQRTRAKRLPYPWMRRGTLALIRGEGRVLFWGIRTAGRASRAAVELPDRVYTRSLKAWSVLSDRLDRTHLWNGLKNPATLTTDQKGVVFFLSMALLLGVFLALNNTVPLLFPQYVPAYLAALNTFAWGVATAVALPYPPTEVLTISPFLEGGPVLAFLAAFTSKMVGAWLTFFIGDALHDLIENATKGSPRLERAVAWMHRNSARFGFWLLALFMAMPFLPDTLALYVFAVSGTSFRSYLGAVAVGTALRYGAVVGILIMVGPERINELFG